MNGFWFNLAMTLTCLAILVVGFVIPITALVLFHANESRSTSFSKQAAQAEEAFKEYEALVQGGVVEKLRRQLESGEELRLTKDEAVQWEYLSTAPFLPSSCGEVLIFGGKPIRVED